MAMNILITNDDGIFAEGIQLLATWAKHLGNVTVVAPKQEQSGKSHAINITDAFEIKKIEFLPAVTAYAVDSTPADCIRFATVGLDTHFDLLLSGINRGFNIGRDIMYSGTVGAIFEAATCGIPAVALSTSPTSFDDARDALDTLHDYFVRHQLLSLNSLYNVNIPLASTGIRLTRQGGPYYKDIFVHEGNNLYRQHGYSAYIDAMGDELDTDAVLHHVTSVTPLTLERTNREIFDKLRK